MRLGDQIGEHAMICSIRLSTEAMTEGESTQLDSRLPVDPWPEEGICFLPESLCSSC